MSSLEISCDAFVVIIPFTETLLLIIKLKHDLLEPIPESRNSVMSLVFEL